MFLFAGLLPYNQKLPFFSPISEAKIIFSCLSLAQLIEPMRQHELPPISDKRNQNGNFWLYGNSPATR